MLPRPELLHAHPTPPCARPPTSRHRVAAAQSHVGTRESPVPPPSHTRTPHHTIRTHSRLRRRAPDRLLLLRFAVLDFGYPVPTGPAVAAVWSRPAGGLGRQHALLRAGAQAQRLATRCACVCSGNVSTRPCVLLHLCTIVLRAPAGLFHASSPLSALLWHLPARALMSTSRPLFGPRTPRPCLPASPAPNTQHTIHTPHLSPSPTPTPAHPLHQIRLSVLHTVATVANTFAISAIDRGDPFTGAVHR